MPAYAGESITTTTVHRFYVLTHCSEPASGGRWVEAAELAPGDCFLLSDGSEAILHVTESARREVESVDMDPDLQLSTFNFQPIETYNLEVADYHTYFVGKLGIWVHNMAQRRGCRQGDITQKEAGRMLGITGSQIGSLIKSGVLLKANQKLTKAAVRAFAEKHQFPTLYPNAMNPGEAAEFLYHAVEAVTIKRWVQRGTLPGWSFPGTGETLNWRILRKDLRKFRGLHKPALRARGLHGALSAYEAAALIGVERSTILNWLQPAGPGSDGVYLLAGYGPVYRVPMMGDAGASWVIPRDTLYRFAKGYRFPRPLDDLSNAYTNRLDLWENFPATNPTSIMDRNSMSIPRGRRH